MTKKTLVAKYCIDVTLLPDAVIDAYKTMIRHTAKSIEMIEKVDFEVLVENQEDLVASMLKAVRSEFQELTANLAEVEASEKSDGFGEFLRLVTAGDADEETEDER